MPFRACRPLRLALLSLPLLTLAVGCGDDSSSGVTAGGTDGGTSATNGWTGDEGGGSTGGGWTGDESASASGSGGTGTSGASSDSGEPGTSGAGTDGGEDPGDDSAGGTDTGGEEPIDPGQLTAGEWRDLDHWEFWLGLLAKPNWTAFQDVWRLYTSQRFAVVATAADLPIADAEVVLLAGDQQPIWSARTDVKGRAELFNGLLGTAAEGPFSIQVTSGDASVVIADALPLAGAPLTAQLDAAVPPQQILDLMFMVDTTGSMSDELSYLQVELADVIDKIRNNIGQQFKIRLSVNFYRDHGDEYLVREFPFTENIDEALADMADQGADGGGDFPEAVSEALQSAIDNHDWSPSAVARLAFIVLDAPPHETQNDLSLIHDAVVGAADKGVRVVPIASSGIDKSTEFFLRFVDIATGGTYVFLTSHSGIGGEHLEPTIGDYQVELLNDLLVRLITSAVQG